MLNGWISKEARTLKQQTTSESIREATNNSNSTGITEILKVRVKETPFTIINRGKGWEIVMGLTVMHEKIFKTKREAKRFIRKKPWRLIETTILEYSRRVGEYIEREQNKNNKRA